MDFPLRRLNTGCLSVYFCTTTVCLACVIFLAAMGYAGKVWCGAKLLMFFCRGHGWPEASAGWHPQSTCVPRPSSQPQLQLLTVVRRCMLCSVLPRPSWLMPMPLRRYATLTDVVPLRNSATWVVFCRAYGSILFLSQAVLEADIARYQSYLDGDLAPLYAEAEKDIQAKKDLIPLLDRYPEVSIGQLPV